MSLMGTSKPPCESDPALASLMSFRQFFSTLRHSNRRKPQVENNANPCPEAGLTTLRICFDVFRKIELDSDYFMQTIDLQQTFASPKAALILHAQKYQEILDASVEHAQQGHMLAGDGKIMMETLAGSDATEACHPASEGAQTVLKSASETLQGLRSIRQNLFRLVDQTSKLRREMLVAKRRVQLKDLVNMVMAVVFFVLKRPDAMESVAEKTDKVLNSPSGRKAAIKDYTLMAEKLGELQKTLVDLAAHHDAVTKWWQTRVTQLIVINQKASRLGVKSTDMDVENLRIRWQSIETDFDKYINEFQSEQDKNIDFIFEFQQELSSAVVPYSMPH